MRGGVALLLRPLALGAGTLLIGLGIPLGWVWVGSIVQGGVDPSMGALLVVLGGIVGSYAALGLAIAWVGSRREERSGPVRHSWNRSMRDERQSAGGPGNALEAMLMASVIVVAVVCTVWFFAFGEIHFR